MKLSVVIVAFVVACGGQIIGEPTDAASPDVTKTPDATQDVAQVVDAVALDVSIDAGPPTCKLAKSSLMAYYPLDGDTLDHSGHGYDATGSNLTPAQGVLGGAMHFDGATSKLHVTSGTASLAGSRTLCAWVDQNATIGPGQPVFWGGQANAGDFYSIFLTAPSDTSCTVTNPTAPFIDHWGTDCYQPLVMPTMMMKWTLVCYAYDTASVVISINTSENKTLGTLYDYALTTLYIGSTLGNGTTTKAVFDGDIDEVSVWAARLQQSELAALWNNGAGCKL